MVSASQRPAKPSRKVENALVCSGKFRLLSKKMFQSSVTVFEVTLDWNISEQPIEIQKSQKRHYNGKKKRHTQKTQVLRIKRALELS